jgi:predicted membrane protein
MVSTARMWWGILLIGLGILFLLDTANVLNVRELIATFWPLILVFIGVRMLIRRQMGSGRASTDGADRGASGGSGWNAAQAAPGGASRATGSAGGSEARASTGATVEESILFGNANARVVSTMFRGGKISCIFGGADVDLAGATLAPGTHTLKVDCVFGGVPVRIPAGMAVTVAADGVLGEVTVNGLKKEGFFPALEWTSPSYASASARLQIDVSTVFGEVSVVAVV